MHTFVSLLAVLALLWSPVALAPVAGPPAAAPATPAVPGCGWVWSTMATQSPGAEYNSLTDIRVGAEGDIWAVGSTRDSGAAMATLIEHYDGSNWTVVPSPNVGTDDNRLYAVAPISATSVWAVGSYLDDGGTLAEHYDGVDWEVVPTPGLGDPGEAWLNGVDAVSETDVWAVGAYYSGTHDVTLIEHYDGNAWTIVPSPSPGTSANNLADVVAATATDAWAVGSQSGPDGLRPLVLRYNGTGWSEVSIPDPGMYGALNAVAMVSATDVWAVGIQGVAPSALTTLTMHYNGSVWSIVPSPNPSADTVYLVEVTAVAANEVLAVGYSRTAGDPQPLVERWDGSNWSIVDTGLQLLGTLRGVTHDAGGGIYAAGSLGAASEETLVVRAMPDCFRTYLPVALWY